jgi:hypothetical protein
VCRKVKLYIRDQCSVQDNFQTAIDALHCYNVGNKVLIKQHAKTRKVKVKLSP